MTDMVFLVVYPAKLAEIVILAARTGMCINSINVGNVIHSG